MAIFRAVPIVKQRPVAAPQLGARLAPGRYQAPRIAPSVRARAAVPTVMLRHIGGNYYTG